MTREAQGGLLRAAWRWLTEEPDHAKASWGLETGPSRVAFSDQDNFRTNRVTLGDYMDGLVSRSPMGHSATYACVNLLAGTSASLTPAVYRPGPDGVAIEDASHPLHWVLKLDPNFDQDDYEFWEFMFASVELQGNAYAEIVRNGAGNITALLPVLNPSCVTVRRLADGDKQYNWTADGIAKVRRQADMLHIRGMGGDGLKGASTLSVCARTFGAATTTDTLARKVFENGVMPSGFLETDKPLSGEQRAVLEKLLQDKFVGAINAGRPMLLDNGLKWQSLSINPEDAQLLESRKFSGEEICRIFGVPPGMVGYGDKASNWGTGKEVDVLGFEKFTLRKRLRRFERALTKQLLTRAERQSGAYIKFNIEGLLRGDSAGRASFYQIMVRLGVLTRNEARRLENLPPIEGGDVPIVQMQDIPLAQAVSGSDGGNGQ
jgi:HK97 family phage portal protein